MCQVFMYDFPRMDEVAGSAGTVYWDHDDDREKPLTPLRLGSNDVAGCSAFVRPSIVDFEHTL